MTALREIKLLKELRSPHLVQLLDCFQHKKRNLQLVQHVPACLATSTLPLFMCERRHPEYLVLAHARRDLQSTASAVRTSGRACLLGGRGRNDAQAFAGLPLQQHPRFIAGAAQVFEYCETDLELVIKDSSLIFAAADVKAYMQMILRSLAFCHERWVLHRDVKPNNFLVAPTGDLSPPGPSRSSSLIFIAYLDPRCTGFSWEQQVGLIGMLTTSYASDGRNGTACRDGRNGTACSAATCRQYMCIPT